MYTLVGVIFLTKADGDIGFPVFQLPRDNPVYTCLLDGDLVITKFLPAYTEQFFFEPLLGQRSVFKVGDPFPFMLFRVSGGIKIVDLSQESEALENLITEYPDELFRNLQIARYLASRDEQYKGHAIRAISKVVGLFSLDQESRNSFISLEASLLSKPEWNSDTEQKEEYLTDDDMYRQFYKYDKKELSELLQKEEMLGKMWPHIYLTYERRFGMDKYLYITGKKYLSFFLAWAEQPLTRVMSQVIRRVVEAQSPQRIEEIAISTQVDRKLKEGMEDLVESEWFIPLCRLYAPLALLVLNVICAGSDGEDVAKQTWILISRYGNDLPELSRRELVTQLKQLIRRLEFQELREFAIWFFNLEEEPSEEIEKLLSQRTPLLAALYRGIA
jgi:hypothetical protein